MVKLVVFDMAGTTVDEDNVVYKTVRDAINEKGYSVSLEDVLAAGAGKEKSQAIHDVLDGLGAEPTSETVQVIFRDFQQRLKQAYLDLDVKEQPGASDLFHQLRSNGIKVALNTGYDRDTAENLVAKIGWKTGQHIDTLVTASDVSRGRPHPDMIELAMKHCGVESPASVVKIGDSGIDIEEGKEAGCGLTFGITTGAQTEAQLATANPSHIIHSLKEMAPFVLNSPVTHSGSQE